jgi:hypothetical protein
MTRTLLTPVHIRHLYAFSGQSPYMITFRGVINSVGQSYYSREKRDSRLHLQHAGWPICRSPPSFSPPPFPHTHNHRSSGERHTFIDDKLHWFTGPYIHYVISTFNTCSWVPIHQSLIDTGGGYNLEDIGFPHHSLRPSQPTVLRFPLIAPPSLRLSISI